MIAYTKLGGLLAAIIAIFALGYHMGEMPYKVRYEALQSADWQSKAQEEAKAKEAIAKQLVQAQATSQNNTDVMQRLADENAQAVQDRDVTVARVRRLEQLLRAQAARPAPGSKVPATNGGQSAPNASGDPSPSEAEGFLVAAAAECERNAARLSALVAEITPQLESPP